MIDQMQISVIELSNADVDFLADEFGIDIYNHAPLVRCNMTFTRSNGSVVSRLYERLTKASRRRWSKAWEDPSLGIVGFTLYEKAYRQGVYDAYKALQDELA